MDTNTLDFILASGLCPISGCWITACLAHLFVIGLLSVVLWRLPLRRVLHSLTHLRLQAPEPLVWHGTEGAVYPVHTGVSKQTAPQTERHPSVDPRDHFLLFDAWEQVPTQDWNEVAPSNQLFLQPAYLQAMEKSPTTHTQARYAMLYRDEQPAGIATFQLIETPLDELGESVDTNRVEKALRWTGSLHTTQDGRPAIRLLLCGNVLVSESCGTAHTDALTDLEMFQALQHITKTLQKQESQTAPLTFVAIKDLTPEQTEEAKPLAQEGYHPLHVDPTMVLELREHWHTMDDYLQEMSSKYRQRYKSARKKGKTLERKSLEAHEIEANTARLQELLDNVCANAPFRLTEVKIASFVELKRALDEDFLFHAYTLDDKIVGFSAGFFKTPDAQLDRSLESKAEHRTFEAYLVGIDYEYNHSHKVYLNMLYDFVEDAIDRGATNVHMGRTAWEIKSTLGAEAAYRITHIRHPSCFFNLFVSPLLNLVPPTEWTPRSPFKD
ncbi:MAG: hypothetical protein EP343_11305 [Deltaproteobacteria bacterium]|nr:MAG: hypothetical protein EP343_11305 [Deltaproteobacteria bacterium]